MAEKIPLVLLPGLLCDEKLWAPQVQALADVADCQVADLTRHESVKEMAASALEAAPEKFALAGLSMGGYVAQEIMRQAPARVTRLALLDTSPRADMEEQSVRRRGLIDLAQKGRFKGVTPRLLPLLIHPDRQEDEKLTSIIFAMAEHVGMDGFIRQQKAIMGRPDGRDDLAKIAVPTLVLCGRQDALTPLELHKEMAAGIAGSRLIVIEESGHLPTLERPAEVNMALREWLRG
ncbi:alpha/beta fold hydrolase [Oceanibaculum indicum]|uniref:Pimeloyl-ACP methyl ester carboxylesterase n=1 Tax=Oceanibaculum indicum TaxID=526216 RepID=A0A420WR27_9PROT|nr:alpha/beta fold hydrolase [Oceanibaculum indicum]RKQ73316.1 pimeloyl-ACP methyl ester carboxylesterase [Oceanibaculum indicum]